MHADLLITNISELVTPAGTGPLRGTTMRDQSVIADAAIAVSDGQITWVGRRVDFAGDTDQEIDAGQRAVVPALVDPHTHAIWAGDRLDDFEARANGVGYEQILARGGGIRHTIAATADVDAATLADLAAPRLAALRRSGAATVEVKSGYGQSVGAELRSLEAIDILAERTDVQVVPTLLLHVPPRAPAERASYVEQICQELIPLAARRNLATAVDVFIEQEAFSVDEARMFFAAARAQGLAVKAHADQFHAIGGVELAVECGALSVDHLEASTIAQIEAVAASNTVAVVLPGVAFHLGSRPAPARQLIDAGAILAVGTDLNPGSSPLYSAQFALAMAVRLNHLTPAEALAAATVNAAAALGLHDRGQIAAGQRADLLILDSADWRDLPYAVGGTPIRQTLIAGKECA
jgi:imidazolonepropionase